MKAQPQPRKPEMVAWNVFINGRPVGRILAWTRKSAMHQARQLHRPNVNEYLTIERGAS